MPSCSTDLLPCILVTSPWCYIDSPTVPANLSMGSTIGTGRLISQY